MKMKIIIIRLVQQVECQVNEKKVIRKDQRIASLESSLREAKSKYEKLLTQCANLTAAMDLMGKRENRATQAAGKARMIRPLQGGVRRTKTQELADEEAAKSAKNSGSGGEDSD